MGDSTLCIAKSLHRSPHTGSPGEINVKDSADCHNIHGKQLEKLESDSSKRIVCHRRDLPTPTSDAVQVPLYSRK